LTAVPALTLIAAVISLAFLVAERRPAEAHHLCDATGSPLGPFNLETYEAQDYKNIYARTMELAGFNQLLPDISSFAVPKLKTGDRTAGGDLTADAYIPPVLLKAIAWIESGWAQASYDPLVDYGEVGPVLVSHDCGYGIMQVTSGMQNISGVPNLDQAMIGGHYAFNIARGAEILAGKWNMAPDYRPVVGARDFQIIENWYYALWGYNGFAFKNHPLNPAYSSTRAAFSCGPDTDGLGHDRSQYPYQELVLGCAANPPVRTGTPLWPAQEVHLPDLSNPAFAGPLKLENWAPCSQDFQCAPMDIPTPNTNHKDPTTLTDDRAQVLGAPALDMSQNEFALTRDATAAALTISNTGTGVLSWRATASAPWVRLSPQGGVALGPDLGDRASTLTITVDTAALGTGAGAATVTIESLFAAGVPAAVAVSMAAGPTPTGPAPTPAPTPTPTPRCPGNLDSVQALHILRYVANLETCAQPSDDVNCDGQVDALDALAILRHTAALPVGVPAGAGANRLA